jgi:hypothetical protein
MNVVEVLLKLNDQMSPRLGNIGNFVTTWGANLASQLTTNIVTGIGDAFKDVIDSQTSLVMTSGAMATIMGSSYEQANSYVLELQNSLAMSAAALPGTTDDYIKFFRQIADDVAIVNKEMNGGFLNTDQYTEQIEVLTSKFQILANQPGLTRAQGIGAFQSILGGRSMDQLEKLEFFRANPSFLSALNQSIAKQGENLEDMTKAERLKVLIDSLNVAITDDTLDKLSSSLGSQIEIFKTKLFDPNVGVFGLMRDIDTNLAGQQSVLEAVNVLAIELFGADDSLFAVFGELLETLGLTSDPMKTLYDGVNELTKFVESASNYIQSINYRMEESQGDLAKWAIFSEELGENIFKISGDVIKFFGENFVDYSYKAIKFIIQGSAFVLSNIDYGAIFQALGTITTDLFTLLFDDFGMYTINALSAAIVGTGAMGLVNIFAGSFIVALKVAIMPYIPMLAAAFSNPLIAAGLAFTALVVNAYIQNWDSVQLGITYSWSEFLDGLSARFGIIRGVIQTKFLEVRIAVVSFFAQFGDGWKRIANSAYNFLDMIFRIIGRVTNNPIVRTLSAAANPVAGGAAANNAVGGVMGFLQNITGIGRPQAAVAQTMPVMPRQLNYASRYNGQIPNAADGFLGGLLGAVGREAGRMPSGAGVVIANSSEMILNRLQQVALGRAIGSQAGASTGLVIQNLNIPNSPGLTPEQTANQVMQIIEQRYTQFMQSKLSSVGV